VIDWILDVWIVMVFGGMVVGWLACIQRDIRERTFKRIGEWSVKHTPATYRTPAKVEIVVSGVVLVLQPAEARRLAKALEEA
jgi:hypothetical protein